MSMFSHPINIETKEAVNNTKTTKSVKPAPFSKKKEKKPRLSNELKESSAEVLREMLAKQKEQFSAANSFQATAVQNTFFERAAGKIDALDPSTQVIQLFHKLVEKMIHIDQKGIAETTFFLDSDGFESSLFQGAKITVTEFSTAPKVFNIQFSASSEALSVFEAHASELSAAFKNGNFGFEVGRIDTALFSQEKKHPRVESSLEKEDEPNE